MERMSRVAALLVALISLAGAMSAAAGQGRQGGSPHDDRGHLIDRRGSDDDDGREEAREPRVSLDDAVSIVRSRYDGKVIRAETHGSDDHPMHQIRILSPDGRVYTVTVDGVSGRIR
jgi:uncharacterized membrane protein YkoI